MTPGLVILYSVALFAVLLLFLKWVLDRTWEKAGRTIEQRHRTIFRVLETKRIPEAWLPKGAGTDAGTERAKRLALKHLRGEIKYFDRAGPFETLEAKRIFMHAVEEVEKLWSETPAEELEKLVDRSRRY
jgi:hypothetical protein